MCGKAYDPRFIAAWPTAKIAVMGGEQAAKVLAQIQISSMRAKGEEVDQEKQDQMFNQIKEKYDAQTKPYYAAARLWVDAIINPVDTRDFVSKCLSACDNAPIEKFNVGVIQT